MNVVASNQKRMREKEIFRESYTGRFRGGCN